MDEVAPERPKREEEEAAARGGGCCTRSSGSTSSGVGRRRGKRTDAFGNACPGLTNTFPEIARIVPLTDPSYSLSRSGSLPMFLTQAHVCVEHRTLEDVNEVDRIANFMVADIFTF